MAVVELPEDYPLNMDEYYARYDRAEEELGFIGRICVAAEDISVGVCLNDAEVAHVEMYEGLAGPELAAQLRHGLLANKLDRILEQHGRE